VYVVGVIDLKGDVAVHARAGERERYAPARSCLLPPDATGDAPALARAYRDRLSLDDIYVADLDAIAGGPPQRALVRRLAEVGPALWLDAGIATVAGAIEALDDGAARVVVGLETLPSLEDLTAIVRGVGGARVVFSLDLRDGVPLVHPGASHAGRSPVELAVQAAAAGVGAIIVLDLRRVGGEGIDPGLIGRVRQAVPDAPLYAGGGVRDLADLARLADVGCDGALVATALHRGSVGRADLERLRHGPIATERRDVVSRRPG